MTQVHAINWIEVPDGHERTAMEVRDVYVAYFAKQPGFVSSTFYRAQPANGATRLVNIVVWQDRGAYDAVVNHGYLNREGLNADGMKILGRGFPSPIQVQPGAFEMIAQDGAS